MFRTVLLMLALLTCLPAAAAPRDPDQYFFQETFGDLNDELALARQEHKKGLMIFFEQKGCPYCYKMKTTMLNQPDVQDYFRKYFRLFRMDIHSDIEVTDFQGKTTTQKAFASRLSKLPVTPVLAFFDLDGKLVERRIGATHNAQEFLWLGEYVADEHYRTESFADFERGKRKRASAD